jgi:hypothetical protein
MPPVARIPQRTGRSSGCVIRLLPWRAARQHIRLPGRAPQLVTRGNTRELIRPRGADPATLTTAAKASKRIRRPAQPLR